MSKIGLQPIAIVENVTVDVADSVIICSGPKGTLQKNIPAIISIKIIDNQIQLARKNDAPKTKALHGLYRALVANMITGVSNGFEKILELKGVGYRAVIEDNSLTLWLGFSHPIKFLIPQGITIEVEKNTIIKIRGFDKELVGEVAVRIRGFRPVEPYKGRGIRYRNERIFKKAGKSGKTT